MNPTSTPGRRVAPGDPPSERPASSDPGAALRALDAELDRDDYATEMGGGNGGVACMTVANRHAGLSEEVYCDGRAYYWEWGQIIAAVGSPKAAAAKVSYVLSAAPGPAAGPQQYRQPHQADTPAGAVGQEMDARGLTVTMNVWEDHTAYSVAAQIAITSPAHPERGTL